MEDRFLARRIDCDETVELSSWAGIRLDLRYVCEACDRLLDTDGADEVLRRSLFVGALVAYARCFKGNEGVRLGLDETELEGMGENNVLDMHRFLIAVRDKHIAHSVNSFEGVDVGVGDFGDGPVVVYATQHMIGVPAQSIADLKEMAEFLIKIVDKRSHNANAIVLYRYGGLTSEQILALPPITMKPPNPGGSYPLGDPKARALDTNRWKSPWSNTCLSRFFPACPFIHCSAPFEYPPPAKRMIAG